MMCFGADDVIYNHVKLSHTVGEFTFSGMYDNYVVMPESSYHGGDFLSVGASYGKLFFKDFLNTSLSFAPVYNPAGSYDLEEGIFLRGSVELSWQLTKHLSMVLPQVNIYEPIKDVKGTSDENVAHASGKTVSIGLNYQF